MTNEMVNYAVHTLSWYLYSRLIIKEDLIVTLTESWNAEIDRTKINLPFKNLLRREERDEIEIVFRTNEETVGFLAIDNEGVNLNLATKADDDLSKYVNLIKRILVPLPDTDEGKISVKFWYDTSGGPQAITREIQAPDWGAIKDNYTIATKDNLERLMSRFKPSHGGQLLLWQGKPGGGKTYALRALCDAWKRWCTVDYIVDPEAFFGGSPSYLMQIISSQHEGEEIEWDDDDNPVIVSQRKQSKWKLLILEDAGEFLAVDAKDRTGYGLARLLNVADGFIGQGLKVILLITTNEELGQLHEAVSRPGRSAAITEFAKFPYNEAVVWAGKNDILLPKQQEYSLAELYSLTNQFDNNVIKNKSKKEFGFGVPSVPGRA